MGIVAEYFSPDEYIREELECRGWTVESLAELMECKLSLAQEIVSGKRRVTKLIAVMLSNAFGTGSEIWLNLQRTWDEKS